MTHVTRARTLAAALLTVSALTACGTTVQGANALDAGGADGLGGTTGTDAGTTGSTPESLAPVTDTSGTTGALTGSTSTSGSSAVGTVGSTTSGDSSSTGASSTGAAVLKSSKPLGVVFFYVNGGNKVLSSVFPGSSASFGDGKGEATAIVKDINAHGGVNGRQIKLDFVPIEATNSSSDAVGSACQGAVQDNKPIAILSIFNISRPLVECAKKTHTLLLDVALGAGDDGVYRSAPELAFSPTQISRDLEQRLILGLAHANGTLNAGTPVGILSETDDPLYGAVVKNTIVPLLKGWGVPYKEATLSTGADTSGMSSAVLSFRTAGVKYVTFSLGSGGIPVVLFMTAANQQGYTPKYVMGDSSDTSFVQSAAPKDQAKNMFGAGTYPLANVAATDFPSNAGEKHCLSVLDKGVGGYKNRGTSVTGTLACELLYGFAFVAKRVPGNLDLTSFVKAYRAVGTAYPAITTFGSDLNARRNDNAAFYRTFGWQTGCQCLRYSSGNLPIASFAR